MIRIKYIVAVLVSLLMLCTLLACSDDADVGTPEVTYYNVSFDTQGGSDLPDMRVMEGRGVTRPVDPVREGYVFDGWRLGNTAWNFSVDKVNSDITLVAVWVSADSIFGIERIGETDTCAITALKRESERISVPTVINGYTVTAIGDGVFKDLSSDTVKAIILPETVTSVGEHAFEGSAGISITVGGALTMIGENAFFGCDRLSAVSLGEGLEEIPFGAFSGCISLSEIRLPATLKTVCENAFEECEALVSVMMHASTESVEDSAFRFCDKLAVVYFYGTPEQFMAIEVAGNGNDTLKDANLCIYSAEKPETDGGYDAWYLDEKGKVKLWK